MLTRICAIIFVALGLFVICDGIMLQMRASSTDRELIAAVEVIAGLIVLATGLILNAIVGARKEMVSQLRAMVAQLAPPAAPSHAETAPTAPLERSVSVTQPAPTQFPATPPDLPSTTAAELQAVRYYYGDAQQHERGPFSLAQMRQLAKSLSPTTPAYRSGSGAWATIADYPELAG